MHSLRHDCAINKELSTAFERSIDRRNTTAGIVCDNMNHQHASRPTLLRSNNNWCTYETACGSTNAYTMAKTALLVGLAKAAKIGGS